MHKYSEVFGMAMKSAREHNGITAESLAKKIDVTVRYIYRLENGECKPGYNTLVKIVRELNIDANNIFYPEKTNLSNTTDDVIKMIYRCNDKSMAVIRATIKSVLENQQ